MEMVAVVMEALGLVPQIRPGERSKIPSLKAVEVRHAPQSVRVKDDAPANICFMLVTLDTSHFERSPLNDDAKANMVSILITPETSHFERSPSNDNAAVNMPSM